MSHSLRHQENRRERAELKQKENRIIRNAHHGGRFHSTRAPELQVRKWFRWPSWMSRFGQWLVKSQKRRNHGRTRSNYGVQKVRRLRV
jgi:hypothetical protein